MSELREADQLPHVDHKEPKRASGPGR
jgi:hypothetical protein